MCYWYGFNRGNIQFIKLLINVANLKAFYQPLFFAFIGRLYVFEMLSGFILERE
jgi:hypothetical protein